MNKVKIYLPDIVGKGYKTYWNFKGRYRVCKGSRRSKKSKTTALWFIYNMMKYKDANTLVVRKTYRTLKDSCFTELKWAIHRLQVDNLWTIKESPLEMVYKPTGQIIYFRGLDDSLKITSITVEHGVLCWMWVEEAFEITSENDFDTLDESMLGDLPEGLFKQVTLTFNPWNEHHWLKKRFFDTDDSNILAITTNYKCNEWLSKEDLKFFEDMRLRRPKRYKVAGLGEWGQVDGLVYEHWIEQDFTLEDIKHCKTRCGLDFGYTNDETAIPIMFLDKENRKLYVWDELYKKGLSNKAIWEEVQSMGYAKEYFTGDSAEPKSIDELRSFGMAIGSAKKGKDSIKNGIQWIQELDIIVHPRCVNFLTEISNYTWEKDKFGNVLNRPIDDFNHLMDAMRYALEDDIKGNGWLY